MEITQNNFEKEVLQHNGLVLVDFWAPWCGPCKQQAPILEEFANEYSDKIKVTKLNVDENGQIAQRYNIMSIPTLIFFKNGKVVEQSSGVMSKEELKARLDSLIQ